MKTLLAIAYFPGSLGSVCADAATRDEYPTKMRIMCGVTAALLSPFIAVNFIASKTIGKRSER